LKGLKTVIFFILICNLLFQVVTERIAIRRVESVGVDAVRDSSNVPPEEMFVAAGSKYNQFGLRK